MNKRFLYLAQLRRRDLGSFAVCALLFAVGIAAGRIVSAVLSLSALDDISARLQLCTQFYLGAQAFSFKELFQAMLACVFPLLSFICAFFPFGYVPILFISAFRGFSLCFSVSAFVAAFGRSIWPFCLYAFGIPELIRLPAFLLFSAECFEASLRSAGRPGKQAFAFRGAGCARTLFINALLCIAAFAVSALAEIFLIPFLASLAAKS